MMTVAARSSSGMRQRERKTRSSSCVSGWRRVERSCTVDSVVFFFFQAEDGIRDIGVTGVQTCALPIWGMTVALSRAVASGSRACVCASTGNTAASAAAYSARAGIRCFVIVPVGKIALGKAVQVLAHGAEIVQLEGNFDVALRLSRRLAEELEDVTLVNSVNPDRIEGQKTAAFEVCEDLGGPPDALVLPVGNAGNITAYWKGFTEWREAGYADDAPRMLGFQAEGAAPLVAGHDFENPETVASAIRIGSPASREGALAAVRESSGLIESVTDEEILAAQELLAREEGIRS